MTESGDADIEPYATALADALVAAIPDWMQRAIAARAADIAATEVTAAAAAAVADVEPDLRSLLATDIDAQATTPLAIARRVVPHAAEVLRTAGVVAAGRDDHARSLHPDDEYDLTPGGFIDFGDDVQAAGIAWGAAKAHIHMRRHAPSSEDTPAEPDRTDGSTIGAVVPNIMDRSRFGPDVLFLDESDAGNRDDLDLLIVDLDRVGDLGPLVNDRFPTIGFGSHVDEQRLAEAERSGLAAAMARSIFFRRLPDIIGPTGQGPAS